MTKCKGKDMCNCTGECFKQDYKPCCVPILDDDSDYKPEMAWVWGIVLTVVTVAVVVMLSGCAATVPPELMAVKQDVDAKLAGVNYRTSDTTPCQEHAQGYRDGAKALGYIVSYDDFWARDPNALRGGKYAGGANQVQYHRVLVATDSYNQGYVLDNLANHVMTLADHKAFMR